MTGVKMRSCIRAINMDRIYGLYLWVVRIALKSESQPSLQGVASLPPRSPYGASRKDVIVIQLVVGVSAFEFPSVLVG